jgi:Tol biopolymer transport system component
MSPDGRYVLFASTANNLVTNSNGNALPVLIASHLNVFLRDRIAGTTTLVSANLAGTGGGNGDSIPAGISTNGRYACFESSASDLISGDTNGVIDVFVRDLVSNTTALVSVNMAGGIGNGVCRGSTMTPDGRFVAFVSAATNLVAGDTNGIPDVFVRDFQAATTALVSIGAKSTNAASLYNGSESPDITPDGRYVAFFSTATNLVPGVATSGEVYVRDLVAGTTTWASTSSRTLLGTSNAISYNQAISADGQFIAFQASTNAGISTVPNGRGVLLRYNLGTGLTDLVSTNANIQTAAYEDIRSLEITPDGRFIVFVGNTNNGSTFLGTQIRLWDGQAATTTVVSVDLSNSFTQGSSSLWPAIDPTARYVAFLSSATNLVTNAITGDYHLYLRDVQSGTTSLIDADTNGVGSSVGPSTAPVLSADGRLVAFDSLDANLVPNDRNHDSDLFVRDTVAATNEIISARHPTLPSASPNAPSLLSSLSINSNARFIAFSSDADNLTANDTNGFRDIFLRDLFFGTTLLVSVATNGLPADGLSSEPAINADGRYVVFTSSGDNLVAGDTNKAEDVFIRDLQNMTTTLVSSKLNGSGPANKASYSPSVSADGRYVLFRSKATDLAVGSFTGTENLFLRDLQLLTNYALTTTGVLGASATSDGRWIAFGGQSGNVYLWDSQATAVVYTNTSSAAPVVSISPDGKRIVYVGSTGLFALESEAGTNWLIVGPSFSSTRAGLRFSGDSRFLAYARILNSTNQVYLYDFQTGSNLLVSDGLSMGAPSGASDSPDISADGRFIAYRSFATNIVSAADGNGVPDLFMYDGWLGTTELLTANPVNGAAGDNRSVAPLFSGDGRTLLFQSAASDLVAHDFNQSSDLLTLALLYASIIPAANGHGPTLTWPARPGETYSVQFRNTLSDPGWQTVSGPVVISGNQAQLTDSTPITGQRFYRVVAF